MLENFIAGQRRRFGVSHPGGCPTQTPASTHRARSAERQRSMISAEPRQNASQGPFVLAFRQHLFGGQEQARLHFVIERRELTRL